MSGLFLDILPFSNEQLTMYINIGVIAILAFFALVGFIRGTYKSIYYFIATLIIFVGGWLLSGLFCKTLFDIPLDGLGVQLTINETNITLTSINETIEDVLEAYAIGSGLAQATIIALITMAVKIVYFLLLVILSMTLFHWIFNFLWLFFRPKKKDGVRPKPKFLSRLGGLGIGLVNGLKYVLLLMFTIGGISSIASSLKTDESVGAEDVDYTIVFVDGTATLVKTSTKVESTSSLSGIQEYLDLLGCYEDSLAGQILGAVKIGDTDGLDELLFDEIYKIKVEADGKEYEVKFRQELKNVAEVIAEVPELLEGDNVLETISSLPQEKLTKLVDNLTDLDIINLAIPVGIEVVLANDDLLSALGDESMQGLVKSALESMKDIDDYAAQFKSLGYALVDVAALLEFNEDGSLNMDFLALDPATVKEIFNKLSAMGMIDAIAPAIIEYVCSLESVKASCEEFGIDIEDILTDDIVWSEEIKNLGAIYSAVTDLGLTTEDIKELNIETTPEMLNKVNTLVDAIFSSKVIEKAIPVVIDVVMEKLPENYANIVVIPEDVNWSNELKPLLKSALVVLSTGILGAEDTDAMMDALKSLDDDKIEEIATYLSQSTVLTGSLNGLITNVLSSDEEGSSSLLGDIEIQGFDSASEWDEEEIGAIFKALKVVLDSGVIGADDPVEAVKALSDAQIESLATNLSNSKFITKNLSPIIEYVFNTFASDMDIEVQSLTEDEWDATELTNIFKSFKVILNSGLIGSSDTLEAVSNLSNETIEDLATNLSASKFITKNLSPIISFVMNSLTTDSELELVSLEEDEWTELELESIFKAVKDIAGSGLLDGEGTDGIKNLTDEQIDSLSTNISNSAFLTKNLTPLMDMLLKNIDLGDGIEIKGFEDSSDWTKAELSALLKSARLIVGVTDDLTQIVNFNEDKLDTLMSSKLISDVLVSFIKEYTKEGNDLEIVKGADKVADDAWTDTKTEVTFTISGNTLTITPSADTSYDKYYVLVNDEKVASTKALTFDLTTLDAVPSASEVKVVAYNYGEVRKLFLGVQAILGDNFDTATIGDDIVNNLTSLDDDDITTIISSTLLAETIISKLEEYASDSDAIINIPNGNLKNAEDRSAWLGANGELFNALKAITIVFNGSDLGSGSFDLNNVIENRDTVLKSLVIAETLRVKIMSIDAIEIPNNEGISFDSLVGWTNTYNADGSVNYRGELDALLCALKICLGIGENFDISNINVDDINLANVIYQSDAVLKSKVIANTLKEKIKDVDSLSIPTELADANDLTGWGTNYDLSGTVLSYGELAKVLNAIKYVLNVEETSVVSVTDITNSFSDIKLNTLIDNKDQILRSAIISNTVKDQILSNSDNLKLPANYDQEGSSNYITWNNAYDNSGVVTSRGEIDNILSAISELLTDTNVGFGNINSFNFGAIFDDASQERIFASKVISETIIDKLVSSGLDIPSDNNIGLANANDRSAWTNLETGELVHLLDALAILIDEDKRNSLTDIDIDISSAYTNIIDTTNRATLLKSYVLAETITTKLRDVDFVKNNIPAQSNCGVDLANDTSAWYVINVGEHARTIEHKEVWNLITSINMILGNEFNASATFNIDQILGDSSFTPTLDANKNNTNYKVNTLLTSYIFEHIFKGVIQDVISNNLSSVLNLPAVPYYYAYQYNTTIDAGKEYDTKTIIESIYQMQSGGLSYNSLSSLSASALDNIDCDKLADAFVISRTYNGSIDKFFNVVFGSLYTAAYYQALYDTTPGNEIPEYSTVQIASSNYSGMTKAQTSAALADDIEIMLNYIKSVA